MHLGAEFFKNDCRATEIRKSGIKVAPDRIKMAAGATEIWKFGKKVALHDKRSRTSKNLYLADRERTE